MSDLKGFIAVIELRLHFDQANSLKSKRKELSSLKTLLRQRFGASVSEVDGQETWQWATLLCALTGDAGVGGRAEELVGFAESRVPEGCASTIDIRSLAELRD